MCYGLHSFCSLVAGSHHPVRCPSPRRTASSPFTPSTPPQPCSHSPLALPFARPLACVYSPSARTVPDIACPQAFSTSSPRAADMAKLCLIGRLGKEPELRYTKTNKEYVSCVPPFPTRVRCVVADLSYRVAMLSRPPTRLPLTRSRAQRGTMSFPLRPIAPTTCAH